MKHIMNIVWTVVIFAVIVAAVAVVVDTVSDVKIDKVFVCEVIEIFLGFAVDVFRILVDIFRGLRGLR